MSFLQQISQQSTHSEAVDRRIVESKRGSIMDGYLKGPTIEDPTIEDTQSRDEQLRRAAASPYRNSHIIYKPTNQRVKRKPIVGGNPGHDIQPGRDYAENGMEAPNQRDYDPDNIEISPNTSHSRTSSYFKQPSPQGSHLPHIEHINDGSNFEESRNRTEPQYVFTSYEYGEDFVDQNVDDLHTYSSSTLDMLRPIISKHNNTPRPISPIQPAKQVFGRQELTLIATICLAHFLTQAGLAQSIAPLPLIANSFTTSTNVPSPSWYSAAYSLTVGTFILPSGRLGDIYGPKRLFVIGWLWFTIASLAAGFNPRVVDLSDEQYSRGQETFFCLCRAMQGIAPALLMPNGLAILGRTYEDGNKKNLAFALFGASAPVGFVVGSVMSSLLAEKTHWSWAYWGLAIACAFMAVISISIIPHFPGTEESASQGDNTFNDGDTSRLPMWKQLDVPGTILGVTALVLINVALNQAPLVSWSTPYTYFILIIGTIFLGFFFFIEFTPYLTPYPLIPLSILSFDTCFVLACISCGWSTFGIWIFYLWEFLESLRGLNPLLAGAQFSPAAISGLLAALTTGFLLSKTTPQVIMVLSMFAFFIGTTIIATAPVNQIYWAQAFFSIIIMPWGMDMSFPSATIVLSGKVGREHQGVAMSLVNTVLNYSISIGLGLAGTVQSNVDKDGTQLLLGFRSAWYFGMGLSGTGIVIAILFVLISAWKARAIVSTKEEV